MRHRMLKELIAINYQKEFMTTCAIFLQDFYFKLQSKLPYNWMAQLVSYVVSQCQMQGDESLETRLPFWWELKELLNGLHWKVEGVVVWNTDMDQVQYVTLDSNVCQVSIAILDVLLHKQFVHLRVLVIQPLEYILQLLPKFFASTCDPNIDIEYYN